MAMAAATQGVSSAGLTAVVIALIGALATSLATLVVGVLNYQNQKKGLERQELQRRDQLNQAHQQLNHARQQLDLMRAGQITQRFTSAVEQLGSDNTDVRIGGLYALEGIAGASEYRQQVTEVIAAYIQRHAPWPPTEPLPPGRPPENRDYIRFPPLRSWAPDVQTAMTILARRKDVPESEVINLTRVDLRGADLPYAKLSRTLIRSSSLMRAILPYSELRRVDFAKSILDHSDLRKADLSDAILSGASLAHADLGGAKLARAKLDGANLSEAIHGETDFTGATANKETVWPRGFVPEARGIS